MSVPSAILMPEGTDNPRTPPTPTVRAQHTQHPHTRLQEEQYETSVPTVADRVAQTVVARRLEAKVETIFHPDSYGYRPRRAPQDAVEVCRRRCWRTDWVIDLDIQQVLRQRPQGPGHQGGGGEHRFAVGSPVREAVAGCAGAEPRRHRADARPGYPTRVSGVARAGSSVPPLCLRCV